mgnify:CR=1 FL=1
MTRLGLAVLLLLIVTPVQARDVYALQGRATGSPVDDCIALRWVGEVLFYNDGSAPEVIMLRNVSNGGPAPGVSQQFVILPHAGTTLSANVDWRRAIPEGVWVLHMDVPDSVSVESSIEIGEESCALGSPPADGARGRITYPVFETQQPANVGKIHLGTDLSLIPTRNNVTVYNAGAAPATARVEVRQLCDNQIVDARFFDVPADTAVQVTGLSTATTCATDKPYLTYVTVVVDQPSLSWVTSIANTPDLRVLVSGATSTSRP